MTKKKQYRVRLFWKWSVCVTIYLGVAFSAKSLSAETPNDPPATTIATPAVTPVDGYIQGLYKSFNFSGPSALRYEVFDKAMRGYMNLRAAGKLNERRPLLTVCDFSKSSNQYRLWIMDLQKKKVLFHDYVAHGSGSGDEFATVFSNTNESHQSSLGFYVTGETYQGEHGTSLRLHGMDQGFNNAAYERGIVLHGADYVCRSFVQGNKRLGRSWGCPAVDNRLAPQIINAIRGGTCLFVYAQHKSYAKTAYWLNKKIDRVPADMLAYAAQSSTDSSATTVADVQPAKKVIIRDTVTVIVPLPQVNAPVSIN